MNDVSEQDLRSTVADARTWQTDECPFSIDCSSAVLEQIRREVERGLTSASGERECGGVLFGYAEPGRIRIVASKTLDCEYAKGPGFVLSSRDEKKLEGLLASTATAAELIGMQPLGWYHSHLRSGIFLSERDTQIQRSYFSAPFQVALVVHPTHGRITRAGFFFRDRNGAMRTESSDLEFAIDKPAEPVSQPVYPVSVHHQVQKARQSEPHRDLECPKCASKLIRRSRRRNPFEHVAGLLGYYPHRCQECLSRSLLKTTGVRDRIHGSANKRQIERKRAWLRTRREMLLWGGGVIGFLAILRLLMREPMPKSDQP